MEIRKLQVQEHPKSRKLYETVFTEDSQGFVDYYYTEKTKDNQIYVMEEEGEIRSMVHLNPYQVSVNGQNKTVHYIVAVATQKEYRGRGYMRQLLNTVLYDRKTAGEAFTFLMPVAEEIYLPYDFRTVCRQKRRFYCQEDEAAASEAEILIEEAKEQDCLDMANVANQYLQENYQVYAVRDEAYYKRLRKEYGSDGGKIMLYRKNGLLVDMKPYIPGENAGEDPKIMIRVLDVRKMLMALSLKSLTAVCFQVTDPIIEENNQCLVLTGTEFSGVMLMEGLLKNSEGTLTAGALASLIFGAKTVEEVCQEDGVIMSARMREEWEKIIPLSRIFLNEVV